MEAILEEYAREKKSYLAAQLTESYKTFIRGKEKGKHATELTAAAFEEFENLGVVRKLEWQCSQGKTRFPR